MVVLEQWYSDGYFGCIGLSGGFMMKIFSLSKKMVTDPVCGMQVDPCKTDLMTEYNNKCFYFCAPGCLKAFQDDPRKFSQTKSHRGKGLWGRYVAKLSKATDGKAVKCH